MITFQLNIYQHTYLMSLLYWTQRALKFASAQLEQFREQLDAARPRCINCGCYLPPDSHICTACGWDNLRNEEAE